MAFKKSSTCIIIGILALFQFSAGDVFIPDIRDTTIECDYLIITPSDFCSNSIRLAEHRNSYPYDDVEKAHVVLLDSIYSEFTSSDTLQKYEVIWYGLKWMYENWKEPFEYLVLMGDDSLLFNVDDSTIYSIGRMPTFIIGYHTGGSAIDMYFSDDWYTTLQCDIIPDPVPIGGPDTLLYKIPLATGRIPCETGVQCSLFINKIMNFDLNAPKGAWKNRIILAADDEFQGNNPDYIQHYQCVENIANVFVEDYFPTKCYLAAFPKDSNGEHSNARKFYFEQINKGALLSLYYGHGHPDYLTEENFLKGSDFSFFQNDSMPVIFYSVTCRNGAFHEPLENSMCKQFLFTPTGGCIAYIASPQTEFASGNDRFGKIVFSLHKSKPANSIGNIIFEAKSIYLGERLLPDGFALLGDPALTLSHNIADLTIEVLPDNINPTSIKCSVISPTSFTGNYYCTYTILDSIVIDNGGVLQTIYYNDIPYSTHEDTFSSSFEIPTPSEIKGRDVRFIAYVWNDSTEGRGDTTVNLNIVEITSSNMIGIKNLITKIYRNKLSVIYEPKNSDYIKKISLFNIRGQQVFSRKFNSNKNVITIDLSKNNISTGKYLIHIETKHSSCNKHMIYMK